MYLAFVVTMLFLAAVMSITCTSQNKFFTFLLSLWILTTHVFDGNFATVSLPPFSFDMRMDRVLLLGLSAYALWHWTFARRGRTEPEELPRWVYAGLGYLGLLALVDGIHLLGEFSLRELVINLSTEATFFLALYVVAVIVTGQTAKVICWSLILVCVISSLIGIYQFFVDPSFFRYGVSRPAFGGFLRANGVFSSDHIQAYWLIAAINVVLLTVPKGATRVALGGLFAVGLVLTFHRMSWIVFAILMMLYWARVRRVELVTWWGVATLVVGVSLMLPATDLVEDLGDTSFVRERLTQDTGSYRLLYTVLALTGLPDHPIVGVGSVTSSAYYSGAREQGLSEEEARGEYGGIHNSYLQIAYFKGVPVALAFLAFLLLGMKDLWRLRPDENVYGYLGLTEIVKFALGGMTNGLVLGSHIGLLMAILMGTAIAMSPGQNVRPRPLNENAVS